MRFSLYLLAATLTTFSITGYCYAQRSPYNQPYSNGKVTIPVQRQTEPAKRPTIRERIRNFFFPPAEPTPQPKVRIQSSNTPPSPYTWKNHSQTNNRPHSIIKGKPRNEPPILFKKSNAKPATTVPQKLNIGEPVVIEDGKAVKAKRPANSLPDKVAQKVGHEQDYSWITGVLTRVPGFKNQWVIRYAGPFEVDDYDGAVMLSRAPDTNQFNHGDLVNVHGKIVRGARGARPHAGAVYQAADMFLIERNVLRAGN